MIAKESTVYSRLLSEILPAGMLLSNDRDRMVNGLCVDSREINKGNLFFACKGLTVDGRQFIHDAIEKGAVAVIAEKGLDKAVFMNNRSSGGGESIPIIELENLSQQLGFIASRYFDDPSKKLKVIGITGTNGKTTTAHLLSAVLKEEVGACGIVGTLGVGIVTRDEGRLENGDRLSELGFTTPDALVLQNQFFKWVKAGVEWVVLEVSSHGLDQGRLNGTQFYGAVLTNVTRDHLDYHGDFDSYCRVKQSLFEWPTLQLGVLNSDDDNCAQFRSRMLSEADCFTYGFGDADFRMSDLCLTSNGLSFKIQVPKISSSTTGGALLNIESPLFGEFNAYNLAATIGVLLGLGFDVDITQQLKTIDGPLGRMQHISAYEVNVEGPTVIVDYAHTPDALEKTLLAACAHEHKQLWCVFGCGGDRDKGKRPLMGEIAERLADHVIITDDNPRSENAAEIVTDIIGKMQRDKVQVIPDRAEAIKTAITQARVGDIVVLAGKGHEEYQEIRGVKKPFSDIGQAKEAMASFKPKIRGEMI